MMREDRKEGAKQPRRQPLFKQKLQSVKDRELARALKTLLEAHARWNATRRDTSANDIRRIVDKTITINPDLRKELLFLWEWRFIKDKQIEQCGTQAQNLLRKDESRKSGKALTNPLKGKVIIDNLRLKTVAGQYTGKAIQPKQKWPYHHQKNTSQNRTKKETR